MTEQALRRDAARNRERLLAAGRELFARRGFEVTLNDVAHHAGVGVGTAYRRFANKEELIEAISVQQTDELEAILREALEMPDAWEGLVHYLERALAVQAADRGMAQILSGRHLPSVQHDEGRDRLAPLVNQVAQRAREAGALREDVTGTDLILLQVALTAVAGVTLDGPEVAGRPDVPQLHRRYLGIALDGLRADARPPAELPIPPLETAELHTLLRSGEPRPGTAPRPGASAAAEAAPHRSEPQR
ncbi:MAG: TetR/AcrR family transcriptional regulator [Dermabacteraceae bacterium]